MSGPAPPGQPDPLLGDTTDTKGPSIERPDPIRWLPEANMAPLFVFAGVVVLAYVVFLVAVYT